MRRRLERMTLVFFISFTAVVVIGLAVLSRQPASPGPVPGTPPPKHVSEACIVHKFLPPQRLGADDPRRPVTFYYASGWVSNNCAGTIREVQVRLDFLNPDGTPFHTATLPVEPGRLVPGATGTYTVSLQGEFTGKREEPTLLWEAEP